MRSPVIKTPERGEYQRTRLSCGEPYHTFTPDLPKLPPHGRDK